MTANVATRLQRKKIYQARSFGVVADKVLWPNAKVLKRDLVLHCGISVIVPLISDRRMILVRQYRYGAGTRLWELPAGTIGKGETPFRCAEREIVEETGYCAQRWNNLVNFYTSPGYSTERVHCFVASCLKVSTPDPEDDEVLEIRAFTFHQVKMMMKKRTLKDAKSLLALFYFFGGSL